MLSHGQLFVTPWTAARQALLVHEIFQARILEWVAISYSRGPGGKESARQWKRYKRCRFNPWVGKPRGRKQQIDSRPSISEAFVLVLRKCFFKMKEPLEPHALGQFRGLNIQKSRLGGQVLLEKGNDVDR